MGGPCREVLFNLVQNKGQINPLEITLAKFVLVQQVGNSL